MKVQESIYRPEQALRAAGDWFQDFYKIGTGQWQGYQPNTPAAFAPEEILLVLISLRGWVEPRAVIWMEALCQLCQGKIPMFPTGIEPACSAVPQQTAPPRAQILARCSLCLKYHIFSRYTRKYKLIYTYKRKQHSLCPFSRRRPLLRATEFQPNWKTNVESTDTNSFTPW
jgi:hypothetical protein